MIVKSITPITDAELLVAVKNGLNLTGNDYQDEAITVWINTVKQDLLYYGVPENVLGSTLSIGCISRGVDDHWLSHKDEYSEMFYAQAERLRNTKVGD